VKQRWFWVLVFLLCWFAPRTWAGGNGLNVVVVVNQNSTNSVQLGNYYCEQRQVPPQNYLHINWTGGNTEWALSDFSNYLYQPFMTFLATNRLTNQIDYVVLSMDIPYRVNIPGSAALNSTTSALFYGAKPDLFSSCDIAPGSTSAYAGSEGAFRAHPPFSATSNAFLVTMITSSNLAMAQQIVDSGTASDGGLPSQSAWLVKSSDVNRNIRYLLFDDAIFNARLRGNYSLQRTNGDSLNGLGILSGAETGNYSYPVSGANFLPGSLADNLTSYGGLILQYNAWQLNILDLLAAGAAGSYGTIDEPCAWLQKFPSPQNYFYQSRGFSLAECYYQSVTNPYQGLLIGEPLAAPFAQPAAGAWNNLPSNALLSGTTNLSLQFLATDARHPVRQVDLFLDGAWQQTVTNIAPAQGNVLTVTLNGHVMNYTVPAAATLDSIAAGVTSLLNAPPNMNATKVTAFAHGDRVELHSTDISKSGAQVTLAVSNSTGATTFVASSGTSLLDTVAYGLHNLVITNAANYPPPIGAWLQLAVTKTNSNVVLVGVTNSVLGTTVPGLVSALMSAVNANAQLTGADGCVAEDFIDYSAAYATPNDHRAEFNLLPRSAGWNAAEMQATLTGDSSAFLITPAGSAKLEDNLSDLQPRAHLYIMAGATNLAFSFSFNTTTQANGYHQLTAVGYEGSNVRTQKRLNQDVLIQNGPLAATLNTLLGGSNSALEATLQFAVTANTNRISKIELFSTGGSLGSASNTSNATFAVSASNLGIGLHPFYAIVTDTSGNQFRTGTEWLRIVGTDTPFAIALQSPPPTLTWPATAGRSYDVLTASNIIGGFSPTATLVPSNSAAQWTDTNNPAAQRFYRIRTTH
jgi:uncharacterized protein (TIGR03790 family)